MEVCVKIMTSIGTVHSFLSNEEVTKRKQRQVNMQGVFVYFLTTNAL